ncbi:hypothetical protein OIU76_022036 [Salix suchowensis]|nr:hypothetical protein OIU76_022036 [Salix suchowensis]
MTYHFSALHGPLVTSSLIRGTTEK